MDILVQVGTGMSGLNLRTPMDRNQPAAFDHDIVRGILMLFVMLDHNDIVRNIKLMNDVFKPLTFHVAAYLVLPLLMQPKRFTFGMARDHAVRYLVPFLFALLGYALAYQVIYKGTVPDS